MSRRAKQVVLLVVGVAVVVFGVAFGVDWLTKEPTNYADGFAIANVLSSNSVCTDRTPSETNANCSAMYKGAPQQVDVQFATPVELSERFATDECPGLTQEGGYFLFRDGQNWVGFVYSYPPDHSDKIDPDPTFADFVATTLDSDIRDC